MDAIKQTTILEFVEYVGHVRIIITKIVNKLLTAYIMPIQVESTVRGSVLREKKNRFKEFLSWIRSIRK